MSAQAVKQDLSEVFAAYLSFATELEEQSKQLLKKLEEASYLHGCYGDKVQSKCQENTIEEVPLRLERHAGIPVFKENLSYFSPMENEKRQSTISSTLSSTLSA